MENVLTQTRLLQSRDCDFTGRWRPSEICVAMQELAGDHSALLGVGYRKLGEKSLAFVLTRVELHMEKYPVMGEKVVCHTWAAPVMKWMFPRYFIFENEQGERLGYAGTIWVLMDLKERKMVTPAALDTPVATANMKAPMRMPAKAASLKGEGNLSVHTPLYSELDVNGHVNNTKYVQWMCDAMGAEVMRDHCVSSLVVNYAHEILPTQSVALHTEVEDTAFCMSGEVDGVNHFSLSGTLTAVQ